MSVSTCGKIKGYIKAEDLCNFIRENWDVNVVNTINKEIIVPISDLKQNFLFNEHSTDNNNWYSFYGHIIFKYKNESRRLFYSYNNVNFLENLNYYSKHNLEDMVKAETTYISLENWGSSAEIITELIKNFGGGWLDENDCDDNQYYFIEGENKYDDENQRKERIKNATDKIIIAFEKNKVLITDEKETKEFLFKQITDKTNQALIALASFLGQEAADLLNF